MFFTTPQVEHDNQYIILSIANLLILENLDT